MNYPTKRNISGLNCKVIRDGKEEWIDYFDLTEQEMRAEIHKMDRNVIEGLCLRAGMAVQCLLNAYVVSVNNYKENHMEEKK